MKKVTLLIGVMMVLALLAAGPAAAQGPAAKGKAQTTCPVMAGNVNKQIYTDYQGQRIYFCCPACVGEFQKDPEKYMKKLKDQGVTPEKSPGK